MPRFCYDAGDDGHTLVGLLYQGSGCYGGGGAFDPEDPPGLTKPAKPVSSKRLKAGCNIFQHAARG